MSSCSVQQSPEPPPLCASIIQISSSRRGTRSCNEDSGLAVLGGSDRPRLGFSRVGGDDRVIAAQILGGLRMNIASTEGHVNIAVNALEFSSLQGHDGEHGTSPRRQAQWGFSTQQNVHAPGIDFMCVNVRMHRRRHGGSGLTETRSFRTDSTRS